MQSKHPNINEAHKEQYPVLIGSMAKVLLQEEQLYFDKQVVQPIINDEQGLHILVKLVRDW